MGYWKFMSKDNTQTPCFVDLIFMIRTWNLIFSGFLEVVL